mgnify:CR=1 FL=1
MVWVLLFFLLLIILSTIGIIVSEQYRKNVLLELDRRVKIAAPALVIKLFGLLLIGAYFGVCHEEPPKTIEGGVEIPKSTKKSVKIIRIGERKKKAKEEDGTPGKD